MKKFSEAYDELKPEVKKRVDAMIADKKYCKDFRAYIEDIIALSGYRDRVDAALFIWEYML